MSPKLTRFVLLLILAAAGTAVAGDYAIDWYTIDGGGGMESAGGTYALSGTIGQADARNHPEPMTSGNYKLTGGFWVIPECQAIPCDYDGDCDVDQADYDIFEACASGSDILHGVDCDNRDFDDDEDVDQEDFAVFQKCISGEDIPGDPDCTS